MLSGLSFRSSFVFRINSLILYDFPLNPYHLTEAKLVPRAIKKKIKSLFFTFLLQRKDALGSRAEKPHYLLFCGFISLFVNLSKNVRKCFFKKSFLVLILQSTALFAWAENVNKLWNNSLTLHVNEWNQLKTKKNKSRHIQIDHAFCFSV